MKVVTKVLAIVVLLAVNVAFAQDASRIGVVDLQKIMQTSTQIKTIQEKLEKDFKSKRDNLIAQDEALKKDMEKLKRDNAVMSKDQKKDFEKKIVTAQQKLEREGQQYQQEISTAHNEAMEAFYNKIRAAISKVAQSAKYDIVLQKDAAPYSADGLDITAKVLADLG
jgi:outer membrane protein